MEMQVRMESSGRVSNMQSSVNDHSDKNNNIDIDNNSSDANNKNRCSQLKSLPIVERINALQFYIRFNFILRVCNNFVGYCVVAWASVVVLGGFVSAMNKTEFLRASFLLLLQALYLAYSTSWPYLTTRLSDVALYFGGCGLPPGTLPGPARFRYLRRAGGLLFFALTFSVSIVCSVFSTTESVKQLRRIHMNTSESVDAALKILYVLLLLNASVAYLQVLCAVPVFRVAHGGSRSTCLVSYFSRAVTLSQSRDYFRISEVKFIDFVYDMMSDECRELIERGALYSLSLEMVPYVYHHPRGFEATLAAMDSPNYCVQEAAILMVGFLVHLESYMPHHAPRLLRFQDALVRRLIDLSIGSATAVDGPRKKAALWSLLMLARHDPRALTRVPSFVQELVSTVLMDLGVQQDSEFQVHNDLRLLPLLNIFNTVLIKLDADSRARFTAQDVSMLGLLKDELIRRVQPIADHDQRHQCASSQMENAATLTVTLLQNAAVPPPEYTQADIWQDEDELADPNSPGITTKLWIVAGACICILALDYGLTYACDSIYNAINHDAN